MLGLSILALGFLYTIIDIFSKNFDNKTFMRELNMPIHLITSTFEKRDNIVYILASWVYIVCVLAMIASTLGAYFSDDPARNISLSAALYSVFVFYIIPGAIYNLFKITDLNKNASVMGDSYKNFYKDLYDETKEEKKDD